jgi:hypothetical protein
MEGNRMKVLRNISTVFLATSLLTSTVMASATSSDDSELKLRVINEASSPIYHLYLSDVDRGTTGQDALGPQSIIETGRFENFVVNDRSSGCTYDIKAVLKDGRYAIHHNLNLCVDDSWTVTD